MKFYRFGLPLGTLLTLKLLVTCGSINLIAAPASSPELYRDSTQPVEQRVADLLARLTLEEKAIVLDHKGPTIERFNLRSDQ